MNDAILQLPRSNQRHFYLSQHLAAKHLLQNIGFAFWCKDYTPRADCPDGDGRMLFITPEYTEIWGVTYEQYVGNLDTDIWGPVIATFFEKLDREAIAAGGDVVQDVESTTENQYKKAADIPEKWRRVISSKWVYETPAGEPYRRLVYGSATPYDTATVWA